MYHHQNNSTDPYAGQYPPPPPPVSEERRSSSTPSSYQYNHQQTSGAYYNTPHPAPVHTGNDYYAIAPAVHGNNYYASAQPAGNDYYTLPAGASKNGNYNPHHHQQQQQATAYDPNTYYPHPNTSYYAEGMEDTPVSLKTPIMGKSNQLPPLTTTSNNNNASPSTTSSDAKKKATGFFGMKKNKAEPASEIEKQQSALLRPVPAPANEQLTYAPVHRPYQEERDRTCCCYNPALTCCSVFCMLIALAFVAAGVAMIIASKIVTDKCTNECGSDETTSDGSFTMPTGCTVICSDALHKGLLYGGAAIAGLAGISVIWRFFMWCCAGYSRK